jgi:hypothetical protein
VSDFASYQAARVLDPSGLVRPRLASRFEPPVGVQGWVEQHQWMQQLTGQHRLDTAAAPAGRVAAAAFEAPPLAGPSTPVATPVPRTGRGPGPGPPAVAERPAAAGPRVAGPGPGPPAVAERPAVAGPRVAGPGPGPPAAAERPAVAERPAAGPGPGRQTRTRADAAGAVHRTELTDLAALPQGRPEPAGERARPTPATGARVSATGTPSTPPPRAARGRAASSGSPSGPRDEPSELPNGWATAVASAAAPEASTATPPPQAARQRALPGPAAPPPPRQDATLATVHTPNSPAVGPARPPGAGAPVAVAAVPVVDDTDGRPSQAGQAEQRGPTVTESEPTVNVTIGRIEVQAVPAAAPRPRRERRAPPVMTREEYLRRRLGGTGP